MPQCHRLGSDSLSTREPAALQDETRSVRAPTTRPECSLAAFPRYFARSIPLQLRPGQYWAYGLQRQLIWPELTALCYANHLEHERLHWPTLQLSPEE